MSDYRNYRIHSIVIPEMDDDDELTGVNLTLEVVSQETLTKTIAVYEGGTTTQQEIVFVCFINMPGRPKTLRIINPNEFDEITVKSYQHESKKSWNSRQKNREKSPASRRNNYPGNSLSSE